MKKYFLYLISFLIMTNVVIAKGAQDPLWIGITTIEGILVPIGTYDKDKWVNTWPEVSIDEQPAIDDLLKTSNGKLNLKEIPEKWVGPIKNIPKNLFLWTKEPSPQNINVIGAEFYYAHCGGGLALKTDLQPTKKVDYSPTPKVGLVTNYKSNVIPFEILNEEKKLPEPLSKAIKAKFNQKDPIEFHIYKARNKVKGGILYFIEAQQKYKYYENMCYEANHLNSWVLINGDKIIFLYSNLITTDCDGKEENEIVPNIVVLENGKYYIVSENYGYEWEYYTIHQILDDGLKNVLTVSGGGC
jgi:hypothetical protein